MSGRGPIGAGIWRAVLIALAAFLAGAAAVAKGSPSATSAMPS